VCILKATKSAAINPLFINYFLNFVLLNKLLIYLFILNIISLISYNNKISLYNKYFKIFVIFLNFKFYL